MKKADYSYHWFKGRLLRQITVLVLLTTTVLLTLFGWQRISTKTDKLTSNLSLTLETNSQWLATSLSLPLYNFDDATVAAICNSMLSHPDISQILVHVDDQTQFFPPTPPAETKQQPPADISITSNIAYQGMTLGKVEVHVSTDKLQQQIRTVVWASLAQIVILDFFLIAAMVFFISRAFIKPMAQLQQASDRIAEGDLQHSIKINSGNELGILASNLETMRITLQGKMAALETEVEVRKKIEAELIQSKNYIDNIVNSMPSFLISVDSEFKVTQWNKQAELRCGISAQEALGNDLDTVCLKLAGERERITEAISTNQVLYEAARIAQYDDILYEDVTIYPLVNNNSAIGAVIRIDDVTTEVNLRNELAHSRRLDAIGQLAGGVAHDFNNMLSGILSSAELLKYQIGENEKGKRFLDIIIRSGGRAAELTEKLLAFARKGETELILSDVARAAGEAVAILQHTTDKRVEIDLAIKTASTVVMGDFSQIQNALINLGINAGHAMPEGGTLNYVLDTITLDGDYCTASTFTIKPGSYLDIQVHDTGAGIPDDILQQIFNPFFTTKKPGQGTGLGLAAVYGTVQDHHGAITVSSDLDSGTTFHIYLPLVQQPVEEVIAGGGDNTLIVGSGEILVVDDEEVVRIATKGILETLGYTVMLADNGRHGLAIFEKNIATIDLVIMDMVMPEMRGEESFYAMQKIDSTVNVLLSSGFSGGANIEQLKKDGLRGFLKKPYTAVALSKAVAAALQ